VAGAFRTRQKATSAAAASTVVAPGIKRMGLAYVPVPLLPEALSRQVPLGIARNEGHFDEPVAGPVTTNIPDDLLPSSGSPPDKRLRIHIRVGVCRTDRPHATGGVGGRSDLAGRPDVARSTFCPSFLRMLSRNGEVRLHTRLGDADHTWRVTSRTV
jgi:hypothetical protein